MEMKMESTHTTRQTVTSQMLFLTMKSLRSSVTACQVILIYIYIYYILYLYMYYILYLYMYYILYLYILYTILIYVLYTI